MTLRYTLQAGQITSPYTIKSKQSKLVGHADTEKEALEAALGLAAAHGRSQIFRDGTPYAVVKVEYPNEETR